MLRTNALVAKEQFLSAHEHHDQNVQCKMINDVAPTHLSLGDKLVLSLLSSDIDLENWKTSFKVGKF